MTNRTSIPNSLKIQIVNAYLQQKKTVSELSAENNVKPSQIYLWASQLFDNGDRCFEKKNDRASGEGAVKRYNGTISDLEAKLTNKSAKLTPQSKRSRNISRTLRIAIPFAAIIDPSHCE